MATQQTPTTEVQAVNILLSTIGEAPIASLPSTLLDAQTAETILENVSRSVQARGWAFNTEYAKTYTQDGSGHIILDTNTAKADLAQSKRKSRSSTNNYVVRGDSGVLKIYDTRKHTFAIEEDLDLDVVLVLNFEDLPEMARRYIIIKASRIFQERVLGSGALSQMNKQDELEALRDLEEAEAEAGDYNIFDDYGTYRVLNRRPNARVI